MKVHHGSPLSHLLCISSLFSAHVINLWLAFEIFGLSSFKPAETPHTLEVCSCATSFTHKSPVCQHTSHSETQKAGRGAME